VTTPAPSIRPPHGLEPPMRGSSTAQRRAGLRFPLALSVEWQAATERRCCLRPVFAGTTVDISRSGALIACLEEPPALSTFVVVAFRDWPANRHAKLLARARVVRHVAGGFAVAYHGDDRVWSRIERAEVAA
jgi:hypothetical protein